MCLIYLVRNANSGFFHSSFLSNFPSDVQRESNCHKISWIMINSPLTRRSLTPSKTNNVKLDGWNTTDRTKCSLLHNNPPVSRLGQGPLNITLPIHSSLLRLNNHHNANKALGQIENFLNEKNIFVQVVNYKSLLFLELETNFEFS